MQTLTYKKSIIINAGAAKVWSVLTDNACIPKFYFGMYWKTTWQKGSSITFIGNWDRESFEDKGNIIDIQKEKFILFNYFNPEWDEEDVFENYKTMRFELTAKNKETVFTIFEYNVAGEALFASIEVKWNSLLFSVKQQAEQLLNY